MIVGCSAGSKAVRKDREPREEKSSRQQNIGLKNGDLSSFDIWGDAVNIAARMESSGETGKIHITEKTADYLEGQGKLTPRGDIDLKNKGTWSTFFLEDLS